MFPPPLEAMTPEELKRRRCHVNAFAKYRVSAAADPEIIAEWKKREGMANKGTLKVLNVCFNFGGLFVIYGFRVGEGG